MLWWIISPGRAARRALWRSVFRGGGRRKRGGSFWGWVFLLLLLGVAIQQSPALGILLGLFIVGAIAVRVVLAWKRYDPESLASDILDLVPGDGAQLEVLVADIMRAAGYRVSTPAGAGDQGVDVLAERDGRRIAIQCKNYAAPVGNKPVQEVFAGMAHYGATDGWVVAPEGFTPGAVELARSCNVTLIDRDALLDMASQLRAADKDTVTV